MTSAGRRSGSKLKYDVDECHERGMTYAVPLKVSIRLTIGEEDERRASTSIRVVKEQDAYFGEIPLMTEQGTFIVNGAERVIVSQLHRSPGAFFVLRGQVASDWRAGIIPYRGTWVDFEVDIKDLLGS